jgi:RNA polymerase sigma-70 factor (ECF subfamily)
MIPDTLIDQSDLLDHAVAKVLGGDREAFRTVIVTCQSSLCVSVASILPGSAAIEDVVQQSFMIAYSKLPEYTLGSGFHTWINSIARYEALNERRRWIADQKLLTQLSDHVRTQESVSNILEHGIDVDTTIFTHLQNCLMALDERAATVLRAHYYDSEDTEVLAKRFGRDSSWVRVTLFRARQALAQCLRAKGVLTYE